MLKDMNRTSLFWQYYKQWVDVYKKDAIREATMSKYLMTQKWVEKLAPDLKISELDASQTPSALPSVDAAVINNTFVREAGVDFKKAIYVEKKDNNSKQWYNLIAAKKDWEKSDKAKAIKEIIKAYHKDNVKKVIEESSEGMDQPVF